MSIEQKDRLFVWHPFTHQKNSPDNILIKSGEGALLYDANGKAYIDAISSWWVNLHGHANKRIAEAIAQQAKKLEQVIFAGFTHEPAILLAEQLIQVAGYKNAKVFYSDNGSTAVEVALKMAIQYHYNLNQPRRKIIAFHNSYHGDTFGSMSSSERSIFTEPFFNHLFEVVFIQPPYAGCEDESINQLQEHCDDAAAFIFEPLVQGAGGMFIYQPEPLNKLISLCKEKNVITIADEVMTGFFRTGKFFAKDYLEMQPDILCMSKGITGGFLPLGATLCTDEVYRTFVSDDKRKTFYHGHSYTANPLACAAALESLALLKSSEIQEKIKLISTMHQRFKEELALFSSVQNIQSLGTILRFELKSENETGYLNPLRDKAYSFFIENGILLRPLGNVIYILPPYCITEEQLNFVYSKIKEFVQ